MQLRLWAKPNNDFATLRRMYLSCQSVQRPSSGPPQLVVLQNPKPFDFKRMLAPEAKTPKASNPLFELTGRVISINPLVLEVLDSKRPIPDTGLCDFLLPILFADCETQRFYLKTAIQPSCASDPVLMWQRRFSEPIRALSAFFRGTSAGHHTCFNSSGMLLSYRGLVEYVDVYNDGTCIRTRSSIVLEAKSSRTEELAAILKAFAAAGFDAVSHDAPRINPDSLSVAEDNSLTLLCSRMEVLALPGRENSLAPLLAQLEELKARATAQTFYLLLLKDRVKLSVSPWPFTEVPLGQIEHLQRGRIGGPGVTEAMRRAVPDDFLSRLPFDGNAIGSPPDPNRYNYFTDEGKLYAVTRGFCGNGRPHCNLFQDLISYEIPGAETVAGELPQDRKNPTSGTELVSRFGTLWPALCITIVGNSD